MCRCAKGGFCASDRSSSCIRLFWSLAVLVTGPGCQGVKPHIYIVSHKETLQFFFFFWSVWKNLTFTHWLYTVHESQKSPPLQCQHKWKMDNSSEVRERRSWTRLGSTSCLKSHTLLIHPSSHPLPLECFFFFFLKKSKHVVVCFRHPNKQLLPSFFLEGQSWKRFSITKCCF